MNDEFSDDSEQAEFDAAAAKRERKELEGDYRRELARDMQREELASREAQRRIGK